MVRFFLSAGVAPLQKFDQFPGMEGHAGAHVHPVLLFQLDEPRWHWGQINQTIVRPNGAIQIQVSPIYFARTPVTHLKQNWSFCCKRLKLMYVCAILYVFSEFHEKVNITFHSNNTVSFKQIRRWVFDSENSNGTLEDQVTTLNLPPLVKKYCSIMPLKNIEQHSIF
jgi:hypothetical protein